MKRLFSYNPNLSQSWMLLGLILACMLMSGIASGILSIIFGQEAQPWTNLFAYVFAFILMGVVVIQLEKWQEQAEAPATQNIKTTFSLYLLLLFFMPLLSISIEPLYMWIPMPECMENIFALAFTANLPTLILAVIAAPLAEEWLCRGVILKGLLTNQTPPYKAIAWSSLIFAVLHLNPWQAIPAFFLGFAIGWVYWRTKSLWPCIFMHAVNNGVAFIIILLYPDISANANLYDITGPHYLFIYTGSVIFSIALAHELWRMIGKEVN